MLFDAPATELIHFTNQPVEKIAVVADAYERAVKILECGFEHVFGLHIQMVCRLIQNKQVTRLQQQAYHRQTASFASAKHFHLLV